MRAHFGMVADGLQRLLWSPSYRQKKAAIEAQVRAEHASAFSSAADYSQRVALEDKINAEINHRLKSFTPSPYPLWSSH
jgi:hypothetical protein